MKYEQEIREILPRAITLTQSIDTIAIDTDLQTVGMDSLSFVRMVVEIENIFDFEFPDEKLIVSEAGTIQELCNILSLANLE